MILADSYVAADTHKANNITGCIVKRRLYCLKVNLLSVLRNGLLFTIEVLAAFHYLLITEKT